MANSLSAALRVQYNDLQSMYNDARTNENAPAMERLSKVISGLAKQIKEHEEHERVTIPRADAFQLVAILGSCLGRSVKHYIKDEALSAKILEATHNALIETLEGF